MVRATQEPRWASLVSAGRGGGPSDLACTRVRRPHVSASGPGTPPLIRHWRSTHVDAQLIGAVVHTYARRRLIVSASAEGHVLPRQPSAGPRTRPADARAAGELLRPSRL